MADELKLPDIKSPKLGEIKGLTTTGTVASDGALGLLPDFNQQAQLLAGQVEDRRRQSMGFLRQATARADQPTLSRDAIGALFSRGADSGSSQMRDRLRALGGSFAAGNVFGGGKMASALAQTDLGRMAIRQGSMRDITIAKAQSDSQDRARRWGMDVELAGVMNQSPSLLGIDALGQSMAFMESRQQSRDAMAQAQIAAKATRKAGKDSMWGSIIGGALSVI